MPKQPAKNIRLYFDHIDLSGFANATEATIEQATPRAEAFSDEGPRRVVDTYDHSHSEMMFFDPAGTVPLDKRVFDLLGDEAQHVLLKAFAGLTLGNPAYDYPVMLKGDPLSAQLGGLQMLKFDSAGKDGVSRGVILHTGAITAGNQTGVNQGATSSGELYRVVFRLLAISTGSVTLKLQHSNDNGGGDPYADFGSLTTTSMNAAGTQIVSTTVATKAWKRVVATGSFTGAVALITAGRVAGN
jgi:hypothetical protein